MIDEKFSIDMIVLMQDHSCSKTGKSLGMWLEILVNKTECYRFLAVNIFPDLGDTQAAFIIGPFITTHVYQVGIDKYEFLTGAIIILPFLFFIHVIKYLHSIDHE